MTACRTLSSSLKKRPRRDSNPVPNVWHTSALSNELRGHGDGPWECMTNWAPRDPLQTCELGSTSTSWKEPPVPEASAVVDRRTGTHYGDRQVRHAGSEVPYFLRGPGVRSVGASSCHRTGYPDPPRTPRIPAP